MANDKDFVVAGAVEVGKDTKVTLGTVTSNNIDLATGNYFADTPTGASTYTISNAGDVQSFQLELTGGTDEVAQNFSTTLYTGTGAAQTITNGIDLSGDGGLVWTKERGAGGDNNLIDTVRGATKRIRSDQSGAESTKINSITSFENNGYNLSTDAAWNNSGDTFVSWTFKKEPSFFDVVTWTGANFGGGRQISHNLGSVPGTIIIKRTSAASAWYTWHRSTPNSYYTLDSTDAGATSSTQYYFGDGSVVVAPTATEFTTQTMNENGFTYVAYLFAHDDAADGLIQCGSYTGNGSTDGPEINLGWQPQWILTKYSSRISGGGSGNWSIIDNSRGFTPDGSDAYLRPNETAAEATATLISPTSTGFKLNTTSGDYNQNDATYIYIAIRAASDPDITWPSSIEWTGGSAPSAPATGETDVFTLSTDDGGTTYTGIKSIDNAS